MNIIPVKPIKLDIIAVNAITQLVANIIIIVPKNNVILLTNDYSDWFIDCAMVSTSLVILDKTSP